MTLNRNRVRSQSRHPFEPMHVNAIQPITVLRASKYRRRRKHGKLSGDFQCPAIRNLLRRPAFQNSIPNGCSYIGVGDPKRTIEKSKRSISDMSMASMSHDRVISSRYTASSYRQTESEQTGPAALFGNTAAFQARELHGDLCFEETFIALL
jgi:hypothetical protein